MERPAEVETKGVLAVFFLWVSSFMSLALAHEQDCSLWESYTLGLFVLFSTHGYAPEVLHMVSVTTI